jgi:GGDEF domain-containing protein
VLPHTDHEHTRLVSERLHQVFQDVEVTVDNRPLHLSIQVGFTACDDQSTLFFDSLLAQVEAAVEFAQQNASDHAVSFGEVQLRQGAEDPGGAGAPGGRDG